MRIFHIPSRYEELKIVKSVGCIFKQKGYLEVYLEMYNLVLNLIYYSTYKQTASATADIITSVLPSQPFFPV
jgi:hypothetical protein